MKATFNRFWAIFVWMLLMGILFPVSIHAQTKSKKSLEDQRKKIVKDIKTKSIALETTQQQKKATLKEKQQLNAALNQKKTVVAVIKNDVNHISSSIERTQVAQDALERDQKTLSQEYSTFLKKSLLLAINSRRKVNLPEKLNTEFRKQLISKQYLSYRQREVESVRFVKMKLTHKLIAQNTQFDKKTDVLEQEISVQKNLTSTLQSKENQILALSKNEEKLRMEIAVHKKAHEQLNVAIERIIRDEMNQKILASRAKNKSKNTMVASTVTSKKSKSAEPLVLEETPESKLVSDNFKLNKGKLPWPVEKGAISKHFGTHPHPEMPAIMIPNNGVDIATDKGAVVRSVFKGKVVGVQFIPGCNYMVLIQHGSFYTVYSNLEQTFVKSGMAVDTKQKIGKASSSEIHFEVWQNKARQNPASWIKS